VVCALAPTRAVCLGLRSIGASLSAVVAAALASAGVRTRSFTLRPRGPAFERVLRLEPPLARSLVREQVLFLVVDEGPGLSGSSFAAVAAALRALGVPERDIVFLPSWNAEGTTLLNETARATWTRHRRFVVDFDPHWSGADLPLEDLSAGAWRRLFYLDEHAPAVHPQHERRKLLGGGVWRRFVGFGRWGRSRAAIAARLADAGFQPAPHGVKHGFLVQPFVEGRPLARVDAQVLERVASYLAFRRTLVVEARVALAPLLEATRGNVAELVGAEALASVEAHARAAAVAQQRAQTPAVHLDARLQPHEWIDGARLWKVDAIDHGDDHFWPGPNDLAWDVAGALAELAPDEHARGRLLAPLLAGDPSLQARLPFYEIAYLSHRAAYAALAAQTLAGSADGRRFAQLARDCRERLRRVLARP
jgi:hypothetical protein